MIYFYSESAYKFSDSDSEEEENLGYFIFYCS